MVHLDISRIYRRIVVISTIPFPYTQCIISPLYGYYLQCGVLFRTTVVYMCTSCDIIPHWYTFTSETDREAWIGSRIYVLYRYRCVSLTQLLGWMLHVYHYHIILPAKPVSVKWVAANNPIDMPSYVVLAIHDTYSLFKHILYALICVNSEIIGHPVFYVNIYKFIIRTN